MQPWKLRNVITAHKAEKTIPTQPRLIPQLTRSFGIPTTNTPLVFLIHSNLHFSNPQRGLRRNRFCQTELVFVIDNLFLHLRILRTQFSYIFRKLFTKYPITIRYSSCPSLFLTFWSLHGMHLFFPIVTSAFTSILSFLLPPPQCPAFPGESFLDCFIF